MKNLVEADLEEELGDAVDAGLAEEPGDETDIDADQDLDEDLKVDEDESSACAPYLVRQMSCFGSRTPGVKDTPFFRFGTGREGGWKTPTSGRTSSRPPIFILASNTETQGVYPGSGRPEAKSPTPACLD